MRLSAMIGLLGATMFLSVPPSLAAGRREIAIWQGTAPGSESWTWTEESNISERDRSLYYSNIVRPTLTVYQADPAIAVGTGAIVSPGGAFVNLGYGKEGEEVARWLNSIGVTAFVLKYRLARTGDADAANPVKQNARVNAVVPLAIEDGRQAMKIVKQRAGEWGLRPDRIGVIGFSAGGWITNHIAISPDASLRPAFAVSAYSGHDESWHVPDNAPAMFIVAADDDRYTTDGGLGIYELWRKAHISAEMHIYAKGDHGFALRKLGLPVDSWNERLKDWLASLGYLKPATP